MYFNGEFTSHVDYYDVELLIYMFQNNTFIHYNESAFWHEKWFVPLPEHSDIYRKSTQCTGAKRQTHGTYTKGYPNKLVAIPFPYLFANAKDEHDYSYDQTTSSYLLHLSNWYLHDGGAGRNPIVQTQRTRYECNLQKLIYHYGSFHPDVKRRMVKIYQAKGYHPQDDEFYKNLIEGHQKLKSEIKDLLMDVFPIPKVLNLLILDFVL